MTLRNTILTALAKYHPELLTLDDMAQHTGESNRPRLTNNLKACVQDQLIERAKDDITGQVAYRLTPTGLARVADKTHHDQAPAPANSQEMLLLNVIADLRAAMGDHGGKIMLSELAHHLRSQLHDLRGEIAAQRMVIDGICAMVGDPAPEDLLQALTRRLDGIAHALRGSGLPGLATITRKDDLQMATAALTGAYQQAIAEASTLNQQLACAPTHSGKLSLILIDSDNDAQIVAQDNDHTEAHGQAISAVMNGSAERALLVRILGEARRTVEWRDAA